MASDTEHPPPVFTCQMQSIHEDSPTSFITAQTFLKMSENLSKMSEKYKDETGLDSEKHIAPFSLTEWKNSSAR